MSAKQKKGFILNKKLLKFIYIILFLVFAISFIRGLAFEKKFSFVIANETRKNIPDLVIKIDGEIKFSDSIYISSIPCCRMNQVLSFGLHDILVESKSNNLNRKFSVFSFKISHTYIGIWNNDNGELLIDKKIYYFLSPLYQ
jgi:hypothetical protein